MFWKYRTWAKQGFRGARNFPRPTLTGELHVASIIADVCNCITALCWQHQRCEGMKMEMLANLDKVRSNRGKRTGRQTAGVQLTVLLYSESRGTWLGIGWCTGTEWREICVCCVSCVAWSTGNLYMLKFIYIYIYIYMCVCVCVCIWTKIKEVAASVNA